MHKLHEEKHWESTILIAILNPEPFLKQQTEEENEKIAHAYGTPHDFQYCAGKNL